MEFYGMPESELDWMRWEAGREWTRQRLRVNNFTDDDFLRLLYREPRPQKMKKNKEEEEINNMKKKKNIKNRRKKNIQNKKKKDEYKKNKKRKREGVDCENNKEQEKEKEKEQEIKKEEEEECADDQPPAPPEEVEEEEEEEYDDFDERCAALPPPLLLAVKRVHMAMDMDKFKKELERSREPKKEEKEEKEECVDDQPPPEDFSRGMGMPRTKTQWLRYEAAMQWTHYRLRVKNFTDEDFARFLFREPRPQNKKKKKKKIKKEEEEINNMKKKDESKKNRKRKREGNDDEKGPYGYGISSLMKEEEYDDFDERVAALPPSLLSAVKRVHMAMDMDTFKEDLERSRDMHEPKNGELTRVSESKS